MKLVIQEVSYNTPQIRTIQEIEVSSISRITPIYSDKFKEGIAIITKTEEEIRCFDYYNNDDYYYELTFKK